jgi:hypothetical protein
LIFSTRSRLALLLSALAAAAGCARTPPLPATEPVELTSVPFFPQTEFQCGPAALATVLAHEGIPVTADELVPQVYVEGLRGSLQAELLGATRRHGLIPYVLEPSIDDVGAELRAGRPVLVLQNLGLARFPVWHYAVVVGMDGEHVVLRSGTEQRRVERARHFLRSWQRGEQWAFVAVAPGELPATATAGPFVRALAAAEPLLETGAVARGYAAALGRWPTDELALLAAAGAEHARGDLVTATARYRQLLAIAPTHVVARNNLANVLATRGCYRAALEEARAALAAAATDDRWRDAVADTVATIEREAPASAADPPGC